MRDWSRDGGYVRRDTVAGFIAKLEGFVSDFSRVAATEEQESLARQFEDFVAVISPAVLARSLRAAIDRALDEARQLNTDFDR